MCTKDTWQSQYGIWVEFELISALANIPAFIVDGLITFHKVCDYILYSSIYASVGQEQRSKSNASHMHICPISGKFVLCPFKRYGSSETHVIHSFECLIRWEKYNKCLEVRRSIDTRGFSPGGGTGIQYFPLFNLQYSPAQWTRLNQRCFILLNKRLRGNLHAQKGRKSCSSAICVKL